MSEKRIDVVVRTGSSKQAIEELDKSMTEFGQEADKTTEKTKSLTTKLRDINPVTKAVKQGIMDMRASITSTSTTMKGLNKTTTETKVKISEVEKEFTGLAPKAEKAKNEIKETGDSARTAGAGITDLGKASNETKAKLAAIDQEFINLVADLDKAEKAVKDFENKQISLGRTVNRNGAILDKNGNAIQDLSADYLRLKTAVQETNQKLESTSKGANKALSGLGRNAGMAGIQVQQFVGQIQGGQSAMLALSQQGADLGFVLGAPLLGAIVGIGASAIGMAMAFSESGESTEELTEKLRELKSEVQLTAEQERFLAIQDAKVNKEKRLRLNDLKGEIADLSEELERSEQINKGIFAGEVALTNANINRARAVGELREELALLQAEESTIEQELSPVKNTKKVQELQSSIEKERELYEAAKFQRMRTEAGFQTLEVEQVNVATASRILALQTGFEQELEVLRANGQSTAELEQLKQDQLAEIVKQGEDRKQAIQDQANARTQQKLQQAAKITQQSYMQSGNLVLSTLNSLVGGSEKAAKAIKIAQGGMAAYMVYSNYQAAAAAMLAPPPLGLGPLAGAGPAAALSSAGKLQAGLTLAAATASAFSGSSVSAPSVSNPSESLVSQGSTGQPVTQPTTTRTIDVRLDDNALLTGSTVKEIIGNILSNDEDTVVEITSQQNNLKRIGAIQ